MELPGNLLPELEALQVNTASPYLTVSLCFPYTCNLCLFPAVRWGSVWWGHGWRSGGCQWQRGGQSWALWPVRSRGKPGCPQPSYMPDTWVFPGPHGSILGEPGHLDPSKSSSQEQEPLFSRYSLYYLPEMQPLLCFPMYNTRFWCSAYWNTILSTKSCQSEGL